MSPIVKDTQVLAASSDASTASSISAIPRPIEIAIRPQAVALEVAVTVNGARSIDGSDKRETFSESTKTVLVHGNGAVIRLSSAIAPGQLLFLTNQKTKKEVVCQVIKSKSYRNVSGYVELEFTEPIVGFWGMRFPTDRIGSQPSPAQPVPARLADTHFPEVRHPEAPAAVKPVVPSVAQAAPAPSALQPASIPRQDAPLANLPHASEVTVVTASVPHETEQSPLPSSPALQSVPSSAENSSEALQLEGARVKQQLSALLFSEHPIARPSQPEPNETTAHTDAAAKVVEFVPKHSAPAPPNHAPAVLVSIPTVVTEFTSAKVDAAKIEPSPAKSLLDSEEVKIPAWLEPLARNAATPAPLEEAPSEDENHHQELQTVEEIDEIEDHEKQHSLSEEPGGFEVAEPSFADRLLPGENADRHSATSSRPNKGALIGAIAAGLLIFAVAGGWYAYHSTGAVDASSAKPPNTAATSSVSGNALSAVSQSLTTTNSPSNTPASAKSNSPVLSSKTVYSQPVAAGITATSVGNANSMPSLPESPVAGDAQPKKAALGKVRLAAPRVQHNAAGRDNAEPELGFAGPEQLVASADPIGSGFGDSNAKQPVAPSSPLPVGGNVKPAKLLSSVQPVYPSLAKSQHVAGDVKINALIDTNGRVTTMKVISGPAMLHQAAQDALRQWKYQPATLDGKFVQMQLTVTLQFRLQ